MSVEELIARALHRDDVTELSDRIKVENPPLASEWDELDPEDRALYERAAATALRVVTESNDSSKGQGAA